MSRRNSLSAVLFAFVIPLAAPAQESPSIVLRPCQFARIPQPVKCGALEVFEDRKARQGRRLYLRVVVLPPRSSNPKPDPVFVIYGGPGQTASEYVANEWNKPARDDREIVLVDQRGTGDPVRLDCALPGSAENVQGFFEPMFQAPLFRKCREELEKVADLRLYTTEIAMHDLDDVRRALGYSKINIWAASYGTRAALVYIRDHAAHVRTATLLALASFSFKNPLFHARSAQDALDGLLAACLAESACAGAFPRVREEFQAVLDRLGKTPATIDMKNAETGAAFTVTLGRNEFAEAMRVMTYTPQNARLVPMVIHKAFEGDLTPFARVALNSNIGFRGTLRLGMLMSVVCSEDVARITEEEIVRETAGTYLGETRVRQQKAACAEWPAARLDQGFDRVVKRDVPALLITGRYDPATPPRVGDEVARDYLPNSRHLLLNQAGHSVQNECSERITAEFLKRGSLKGLDTSCVKDVRLAPFEVGRM